jgi:hypothetical protein
MLARGADERIHVIAANRTIIEPPSDDDGHTGFLTVSSSRPGFFSVNDLKQDAKGSLHDYDFNFRFSNTDNMWVLDTVADYFEKKMADGQHYLLEPRALTVRDLGIVDFPDFDGARFGLTPANRSK